MKEFTVKPNPDDPALSTPVRGRDQDGEEIETSVVTERPLTLFLNSQEIVTMMTIGDHPDLLAVGYLFNQNMLRADDVITAIEPLPVDQHDLVGTALHRRVQAHDVSGIILAVTIQRDDPERAGRPYAIADGCTLTAAPCMPDDAQTRLDGTTRLQHCGRAVVAAVIHHDDFVFDCALQSPAGLLDQVTNTLDLVVHRNHH